MNFRSMSIASHDNVRLLIYNKTSTLWLIQVHVCVSYRVEGELYALVVFYEKHYFEKSLKKLYTFLKRTRIMQDHTLNEVISRLLPYVFCSLHTLS